MGKGDVREAEEAYGGEQQEAKASVVENPCSRPDTLVVRGNELSGNEKRPSRHSDCPKSTLDTMQREGDAPRANQSRKNYPESRLNAYRMTRRRLTIAIGT